MTRILVLAVALAAALAVAAGAGATDQTVIPYQPGDPTTNGCPTGFEALALADLAPYGYQVPSVLDSPANGGNGDGVVCGKPWTPQEQAARLPNASVPVVFDFVDDALPAVAAGRQLDARFAMGTDCTNKSLFRIDLTQNGQPVTTLEPGTYWLTVDDTCPNHDFHLVGPGIDDVITTVPEVGVVTVKVRLEQGTYRLLCDPHEESFDMFVDFQVGVG